VQTHATVTNVDGADVTTRLKTEGEVISQLPHTTTISASEDESGAESDTSDEFGVHRVSPFPLLL
jgi:hypothetical protein